MIKHYALRLILWLNGHTLFKFIKFLDQCAKLILLKKVGGGYIFIHLKSIQTLLRTTARSKKVKPASEILKLCPRDGFVSLQKEIVMPQQTNQFAVANWVIVPTGQTPSRPEDQKWFLVLSGVALFSFQGTADWRRDSLGLQIDLTDPIRASGRSAPPGRELKFEVEQWAPFATMNSIFDQDQSVNAGFAVDAFRVTFFTRDTFTRLFGTLEADLAVRDTDAFIFRIGYHLTLVGTIVEVTVDIIQ